MNWRRRLLLRLRPDGLNLVHPRQPDLVGKNLWNMKDADWHLA